MYAATSVYVSVYNYSVQILKWLGRPVGSLEVRRLRYSEEFTSNDNRRLIVL